MASSEYKDRDFDEVRVCLKSLKAETVRIKDLHWKWEDPKTKQTVEKEFLECAESITNSTVKIQNTLGIPKPHFIPDGSLHHSKNFRRSFRNRSQRHKALSNIEKSSANRNFSPDEFHDILKSLKAEAIAIKDVHKEWGNPKTKDSVDDDFLKRAGKIIFYSDKIQMDIAILKNLRDVICEAESQQQQNPDFQRHNYTSNKEMESRSLKRRRNDQDWSDGKNQRDREEIPCHECMELKRQLDYYKSNANVRTSGDKERIHLLEKDLRKRDEEMAKLYQEIENQKAEIQRLSHINKGQRRTETGEDHMKTIERLRNELASERRAKEDALRSKRRADHGEDHMKTIERLRNELASERRAKEDALRRLSASAGSRLRDNNPGITDLSDPNRPMKLAEQMSELYDNEWTTTLEDIMDKMRYSEVRGLKLLLNILTNVYTTCKEAAEKQLTDTLIQAVVPEKAIRYRSNTKDQLSEPTLDLRKAMKDYRKIHWECAVPLLKQVIRDEMIQKHKFKSDELDILKDYTDTCVKLCWLMQVQDPPVHMEWNFREGDPFETSKFRTYTSGGNEFDYIVWPVLYLHYNGPLLCKGIAQGRRNATVV